MKRSALPLCMCLLLLGACADDGPEGIAAAIAADTTVTMDFFHRPLPEMPLPNDLATRHDSQAPTRRRINASLVAPTGFEKTMRRLVDGLDGWGTYSPISIPFSGPIDVEDLAKHHHNDDYATADDLIYLIDVTEGSPTYGQPALLDIGNGNFPVLLERMEGHYWESDARDNTNSLLFEEHFEDKNGNDQLDPGEDTDLDGLLDKPNYWPWEERRPDEMTLSERAEALMPFYERETNTLIVRALVPLRPRTTYAVVVTRRLLDSAGKPVGSPFPWVHHLSQTEALRKLPQILSDGVLFGGLDIEDVAFAWTFTTGTMYADIKAVRDGLYGHGAQKHLATEFPADLATLHELFDGSPNFPKFENMYTISGETFAGVAKLLAESGALVSFGGPAQKAAFMGALDYVDYHVFGTYESPQLFRRTDDDGRYLDYNEMSWPADLANVKAPAEPQKVTFWMTVPRKEATPDGKPRGVVILGHGYTGNKTETFGFHNFFSQAGLAVVAIDNVSHGFSLNASDSALLKAVLAGNGIGKMADALTSNRSWDQDLDGLEDSGADFWTAYTFHTRDVVRQTAIDYMQLIRVLRGWDGQRSWPFDTNANGKADDLAGDLNGDGVVDVGGADMPITMTGGSLGGIMAAVVGGLEPHLVAVAPIAGGGGLIDVGVRSIQGGIKEAVQLRLMGPLYIGYPDKAGGTINVQTVVPSLNDTHKAFIAQVPQVAVAKLAPGDSVLAENLDNGEYDCALLFPEPGCAKSCADKAAACLARCLTFRVALPSDIDLEHPQRHKISFYRGNVFQLGVRDPKKHMACKLTATAGTPVYVLDTFEKDVEFHYRSEPMNFARGAALSPLAEGLGLHRARPEMRRFMGFAQMVLDPADPAVMAKHFLSGEQKYATGEVVNTHALVVNTVGDMNVPVNTGAAIGRAAGLLDYSKPIDAWGGRTVNQVLIDTKVLEAVDTAAHFVEPDLSQEVSATKGNGVMYPVGRGVLFDPENLSQSPPSKLAAIGTKLVYNDPLPRGNDGFHVPRLDPPLHKHAIGDDGKGGISGTFFPYVEPGGKHGTWEPGNHTDRLRQWCEANATQHGKDPAFCAKETFFDHGSVVIYALGNWLASGGTKLDLADPCLNTGKCSFILPPPKSRK